MGAEPIPRRLLLCETLDPEGALFAWLSPDVRALGWQVRVVPSQELIHLLGPEGFQRWLSACVEAWRPDVLLCHPPYDHLSQECAESLRARGTRLVAFGFDDPIVFPGWWTTGCLPEVVRELDQLFDLYASTSQEAVDQAQELGARGFRVCRWAFSSEPLSTPQEEAEGAADGRAFFAGSAYPERVALLSEVARAGVPLRVYGQGWTEQAARLPGAEVGPRLPRTEWLARTRAAPVVIGADGWEGQGFGLVKARLLEVALLGSYQISPASPDLDGYFPAEEVGRFRSAAELIDGLRQALARRREHRRRAGKARERALREHSWQRRWPELLALLEDVGRPLAEPGEPPQRRGDAWSSMLSSVAHQAEASERAGLARACQLELLREQPDSPGALAGAGRSAFSLGRHVEAARWLARALQQLARMQARHSRESYLRLQGGGPARGMGVARLLSQAPELYALRLVALLRAEQCAEAQLLLDELACPDLLVTVAGLVQAEGSAGQQAVYAELFARALAALPQRQLELQRQQSDRWQSVCG